MSKIKILSFSSIALFAILLKLLDIAPKTTGEFEKGLIVFLIYTTTITISVFVTILTVITIYVVIKSLNEQKNIVEDIKSYTHEIKK